MPLDALIAGSSADSFFESAMIPQDGLAKTSGLVGTGLGAGRYFMLVIAGLLGAIGGVVRYRLRALRDTEDIL